METHEATTDGPEQIAAIQSLHQDLLELSESRLPNIERLCADLDAHIEAFKQLLDRKPKNEQSRYKLSTLSKSIDIQPSPI